MATEVTRWAASDGATFESEALADHYDEQREIIDYIDSDDCGFLCSRHGGESMEGHEVLEWVNENSRLVLMLLPEEKSNDES